MEKKDLKIELRAVYYTDAHIYRVLEYRFSPGQKFHREPKNLLEKIERFFNPLNYDWTWNDEWIPLRVFNENNIMGSRDFYDDENYGPYFVNDKREFERLKENLKTYGDLEKFLLEYRQRMWAKWKEERDKWLEENQEWT